MFNKNFTGLKLPSAVLALLLLSAGLCLGACSSNKDKKTEKTGSQESAAVATQAPAPTGTPAAETSGNNNQVKHGLPPEITEPCSGKNEGDDCYVTILDGSQIKGTCVMTRANILGCKPTPTAGHTKPGPSSSPPNLNKNPEKLNEYGSQNNKQWDSPSDSD